MPTPGSLVVEAPTIPSEREIVDPRTPAHLSPIHFEHPKQPGRTTPTKLDVEGATEGVQRMELRPEDVFIGQKLQA